MKKLALLLSCCALITACTTTTKGVLRTGETLYIYADGAMAGSYAVAEGNCTYVSYEVSKKKASVTHTDYYTKITLTDYYYGNSISNSVKSH